MDCPQCGAEVPSDDAFCGKCGYAMRSQAPERVDQSRIRVYEERRAKGPRTPEAKEPTSSASSQQRLRTRTRLGMAAIVPAEGASDPDPTPVDPPAAGRPRRKVVKKTMLGIPREDIPPPPDAAPAVDEDAQSRPPSTSPSERASGSHRVRARVRYDSANEPVPVVRRRQHALRGLAVLVILAAAWLGYRFLTLNG